MFYCAHNAFKNNKYRIWYLIALLLGTYNLFFVVEGRTGQLIFTLLVPLFAGQRFGKKGFFAAIFCIFVLAALYINFSDKSARMREGIANTMSYFNHVPEKKRTSMGVRYKFWENSLTMIAEKPLLGHGTGSFAEEYGELASPKKPVQNPHNEFLLIAVQFGLVGMVAYLGFLFSQYWCSRKLPVHEKWLAQGLLVTLITTSLFNSPFLDHTEGHWFAVMIALCLAPKTQNNSSR
jgi:O-antigen ligase